MLRAYGDGTLFGEPYGEGPVRVIWLHGWGRRGEDFAAAANELARRGVASVALDLPGFGASPAPASPSGARGYAEMVAPVLREIGDAPFVLVGHSFGGTVASVIAADHPEIIRSLVLDRRAAAAHAVGVTVARAVSRGSLAARARPRE